MIDFDWFHVDFETRYFITDNTGQLELERR